MRSRDIITANCDIFAKRIYEQRDKLEKDSTKDKATRNKKK
jgi:hypothetical protein